MSDSIREKIMQNLVVTLASISVGNGYKNSIRGVYRYEMRGNTVVEQPFIEINPLPEEKKNSPNPYTSCTLPVSVDVWIRHDKQIQPESTDALLISFIDDITAVLMTDNTRGGFAIDTEVGDNFYSEGVIGQSYAVLSVIVTIHYRHNVEDTTQQ